MIRPSDTISDPSSAHAPTDALRPDDGVLRSSSPAPPRATGWSAAGDPAPDPSGEDVATAAADLVLDIGAALHTCGTASDRLEAILVDASERVGLRATFFVTPTSILATVTCPGGRRETRVVRDDGAGIDLGRVVAIEAALDELGPDRAALDRARAAFERAQATVGPGRIATLASFAGTSACVAIFFQLTAFGALVAAAGGTCLAMVLDLASRHARLERVAILVTSAALAFMAALVAPPLGEDAFALTLASLIVVIPGLSLTLAMRELAARHLVSGTARLMGAMMDALAITFGMAIGGRLAERLFAAAAAPATAAADAAPTFAAPPVGEAWLWAALLIAPITFGVLFRAPARTLPWSVVTCVITWFVAMAAGRLDPLLAPMLGAVAAGMIANTLGRILRVPAAVFVVPGIMLLLPGSLGVRSMASLLTEDVVSGMGTAANTVVVAVALATGLLVANAVLPPRLGR